MDGKWHLGDTPDLGPMNQGFGSAYYIKRSNNQTKQLWRGEELVADIEANAIPLGGPPSSPR